MSQLSAEEHKKNVHDIWDWIHINDARSIPRVFGCDDVLFGHINLVYMSQRSPEEHKKDVHDILD